MFLPLYGALILFAVINKIFLSIWRPEPCAVPAGWSEYNRLCASDYRNICPDFCCDDTAFL